MKRQEMKKFAIAALTCLSFSACVSTAPPKVVVDPALASNAEILVVDGLRNRYWGKPLKFGPYRTEKTRVGESSEWSTGFFGRGVGMRTSPQRFVFVDDAGERYQVECRSRTPILRRSTRHSEWTFPIGETKLGCVIRDPAGDVASLALRGYDGDYSGETGFGHVEDFEIAALHQFAGENGRAFRLPAAIGYELRQHGKVVASVDTLNRGEVYLARDLGQRERTAAALTLTVLMFFEGDN